MTTINQIYAFAEDATSANVLSNAAYSSDAGRLAGHVPGIARQELENAALRNLSRFSRGTAEFLATYHAPGVVDDGDMAKIIAAWEAAIAANAPTPETPTVDEFYIDAGAMTPTITAGASLAMVEDVTNDLTRNVMSFQGSTANTSAAMNFRLPANWDRGTIKAKVLWTPATGASAADNVRFSLAGVAVSNDDALDVALGTAVTIDGDVIAVGDLHVSPASAALTIAGTPQVGDYLRLVLTRDYDYGASPMSEAAQLLGMVIQFGLSGNIAAW